MNLHKKNTRPGEAGFSLLEILIAVMILVLMGGVVTMNLFPHFFRAKRHKAEMDIQNIKSAIDQYRLLDRKGRLPEASEFPHVLTQPGENGDAPLIDPTTLEDGKLLDPWGNPYEYRRTGNSFEIISYGDDGAPGGEGDSADISSKKSEGK